MDGIHAPEYQFMLKKLREARHNAGLTQQQVAQALGIKQHFVSRFETGERRIDPVHLWRFATLYGYPLEFFFPKTKSSKQKR